MRIEVIGVYPVEAPEPCHLIELVISDPADGFDLAGITQESPGTTRDNLQVPYDERYLSDTGETVLDQQEPGRGPTVDAARVVFFFHYLELSRPLLSPLGPLELPPPSARPARLDFTTYLPL